MTRTRIKGLDGKVTHYLLGSKMWELILITLVLLYAFYVVANVQKLNTANTVATFTAQGTILGSQENDFLVLDLPILPISTLHLRVYNTYKQTGSLIKTAKLPIEFYFGRQEPSSDWQYDDTFENSLWKYLLFGEEPSFHFEFFQLGNFLVPLYLCRGKKHPKIDNLIRRWKGSIFPYRIDSPVDLYALQQLQFLAPQRQLTLNTFQFLTDEQYQTYHKSKTIRELRWYDLIHYEDIIVKKAIAAPSSFLNIDIEDVASSPVAGSYSNSAASNSNNPATLANNRPQKYIYTHIGLFDSFVGTLNDNGVLIGDHWQAQPIQDNGLEVEYDDYYWLVFNTDQASNTGLILQNQRFGVNVRDIILNKSYKAILTPLEEDYNYEVDNKGIFTVQVKKFQLSFLGA